MDSNQEKKSSTKSKVAKPWWRIPLFLIFSIFILFFIASVLVQLPYVQNLVGHKITEKLSERLGSDVEFEEIRMSIKDGLIIKNFYLQDEAGDTLIYSSKFSTKLGSSLQSLLGRDVSFNRIFLEDAQVNLKVLKGTNTTNLEQLLKKLERKENSNSDGDPFLLDFEGLDILNSRISLVDENTGAISSFKINHGEINIDGFNLGDKVLEISSIVLDEPQIQIITAPASKELIDEEIESNIENIPAAAYQIFLKEFVITDGGLIKKELKSPQFQKAYFDKNNFKVEELNLQINDTHIITDGFVTASLKNLSGLINESIEVDDLYCKDFTINNTGIELKDFGFSTDRSSLTQQVLISFTDFDDLKDNIENVVIDAKFQKADFALKDIVYVVPGLGDINFIKENIENRVRIQGSLFGDINNLKGSDIDVSMGDRSKFKGTFEANNLNKKGQEYISLSVDSMATHVNEFLGILNTTNLPENIRALGQLEYKGIVEGFLNNIRVDGMLLTDIGQADLNINLKKPSQNEELQYSGEVDLNRFDLKAWTGNPDFGLVSLTARVTNGMGTTLESANVNLATLVKEFTYKDYTYNDVKVNGEISSNKFNGFLSIDDQNVSLDFTGVIEGLNQFDKLTESEPILKFKSDIKYVDLNKLNLSEDQIQLSGNIDLDLEGKDFRMMTGKGRLDKLLLIKNDSLYSIDSLLIASERLTNDSMLFTAQSEIADFESRGIFDLTRIPQRMLQVLKANYPYHTRGLVVENIEENEDEDFDYSIRLDIHDSKNLLELAGVKNVVIKETTIDGNVKTATNAFEFDVESPIFSLGDINLMKVKMNAINKDDKGAITISVDSSNIQSFKFNPMEIVSRTSGDTIYFDISTEQTADSLQNISIVGQFIPHPKGYEINIEKNELYMLDEDWLINPFNRIILGNKYLELENLTITDGRRSIGLDDIMQEGLNVDLRYFDVDLLNPTIDYDKMIFTGVGDANIRLSSIFGSEQYITGFINVPDLRINDDPFGQLLVKIEKENNVEILKINSGIVLDSQIVTANGGYNIEEKTLDVDVDMSNYPLNIFEYIIPEGISQTKGGVDIIANVSGPLDDLSLKGDAVVRNGATKIDYLGTYYTFDEQFLTLDENFIDATGVELTDTKGNVALLNGGLNHDFFADFTMDITISSPQFIGLNTSKTDNPLYYGFGEGNMTVDFSGPFSSANIYVDAITSPNAKLSFPITSGVYDYDESFIKFKGDQEEDEELDFEDRYKLLGLNFEMNLEVTDEAELEMIFNERVGEILRGNGTGNISIDISRTGDFEVFGDYNVSGGEYLFTAYDFFAKPFSIVEGGTLRWTGDPFDATLDVEAEYVGVRAPLNVFLDEYISIGSAQLTEEARNRTDIYLKLLLDGTLYNPVINFDIEFPDVTGELKTYVDSKMRTLRSSENGINNQVVGLLVFKNFLPYDNPLSRISAAGIGTTVSSNVTEFFTSQIGLIINELLAQNIGDDSFLREVNVNIGLSENQNIFDERVDDGSILPDELNVDTRYIFKNDKFVFNLNGNYVWEPTYVAESYIIGDASLEYYITDDRKLKLRIYGKLDYDEIEGLGRKYKQGAGISYRTEFGSLSDFVDRLNKNINQAGRVQPSTSSLR